MVIRQRTHWAGPRPMNRVLKLIDGYPAFAVGAMARALGISEQEALARVKAGGLTHPEEDGAGFRGNDPDPTGGLAEQYARQGVV